ncbi:MAG: hypothetical protein A3C84_03025 [Candidatus Ryanbacteria bacterium RIFCSPHIGHO2_02_FULL_48_12]|uniref:SpaA-like prealbumin fold domain-containing protein n=1 Tax=Candidatus Ryanbacteria bacterium RIFCSPHIGHO2_01_FULL_48_27 TaxID=1802115 RepID=A0A1G2G4T7_9BACT|nr:MAG: hypothetical protein A2756_01495 [Candidatus Ryanbacteria bacterium RIFCSPHIGHO2_01_FULL_48_27]OGZ49073.1 MAG: hypothetical protein A3C84_03025 [Candidatus Ryanbacteria bacterium RIFCSPHIGHO2_02_FULL_48_12]
MKKQIALGLGALALAATTLPLFAAFEAHVINVTAKIENALNVPLQYLDFGTVFPQEKLEKPVTITLSQSFVAEGRVDDVEYFIRQKPKCAITTAGGTAYDQTIIDGKHAYTGTGHVVLGDNPATTDVIETSWVDCGVSPRTLVAGETWGMLPNLCPYLSKHSEKLANGTYEDGSLPSFHQPWKISATTSIIYWNDVHGRLAKSNQDTSDTWMIDLAVPCFGGYCAQDWASFVHGINPDANPDNYTQLIANEHKVFGCDLWVEVSGVSLPGTPPPQPEMATLTVTKVVTNDNGGNNVIADFALKLNGNAITSGAANVVAAGAYAVSETGVGGYTATYSGDCDVNGNVVLTAGQVKSCTITNDDIAPNITLTKVVLTGAATPSSFLPSIGGTVVSSGSSLPVMANTAIAINETLLPGYEFVSITGDPECPSVAGLGGTATLDEGEAISCTITNQLVD